MSHHLQAFLLAEAFLEMQMLAATSAVTMLAETRMQEVISLAETLEAKQMPDLTSLVALIELEGWCLHDE